MLRHLCARTRACKVLKNEGGVAQGKILHARLHAVHMLRVHDSGDVKCKDGYVQSNAADAFGGYVQMHQQMGLRLRPALQARRGVRGARCAAASAGRLSHPATC